MNNYANGTKQAKAIKTCERCGDRCECNAADIENCDCRTVKVSNEVRDRIRLDYRDCLCVKCLKEVFSQKA